MPSYRVEIDGETVWTGEGDTYKVIPAEFRDRPAQDVGDPYPSPRFIFEGTEDGGEQIIGIQVSEFHELAMELGPEGGYTPEERKIDDDGVEWVRAAHFTHSYETEDDRADAARSEWEALNAAVRGGVA